MRKKIGICVCLCVWVTHGGAESFSQSEKLDQVRSDIDKVKNKMQQIKLQKNTLTDQLAVIENRYGKTAALLRDLRNEIESKHGKLIEIRHNINNFRDQIAKHGKELSSHIKAAYAMGQQEKLKLILNQQDPALSGRMMMYHGYFNKTRLKKLAEIEQSVKHLEQLNQQQQTETNVLERDLEQRKLEQAALDKLKLQRNELLRQLANDFTTKEQQLSLLLESESKLTHLIDALREDQENLASESARTDEFPGAEDKSDGLVRDAPDSGKSSAKENISRENADFSSLKGKLPWPIKGKVAASGSEQLESIRDGVLIEAGEGTEIHAVNTGKVVYSEWLRGYGLLMIIDHGRGYMTLYAFNQSLYKRVGERVLAGDVIASVGQSGGRSRSGLYFGIRKNGRPVDPFEWCSKSSRDQMG